MIELFTIVVQMAFGWHWRHEPFAVLHSKLVQAIFEVFLLGYKEKYQKDCLKKFGMEECKGYTTPMPAKHHLGPDDNGKVFDQKVYRSMIGSLL